MEIDVSSWSRLAEIVEYAERRCIKLDEAIEQLVNSGLSHTLEDPTTPQEKK